MSQPSKVIHIREPFYTAGRLFGWTPPLKPIGLGIDWRTILDGEDKIEVRVGDSPKIYRIDRESAIAFVEKFKSFFNARGTKLGVIAWDMFVSETQIREMREKLF